MTTSASNAKKSIDTQGVPLLVIDDEENMRHMLSVLLGQSGYEVDTAADGRQAMALVEAKHYDMVLCDLKMPNMDGMTFLKTAMPRLASSCVIVMSAYGSLDTAIEAMKLGAYDYISKPFKGDEILLTLKKAEEREHLKRENIRLKEQIRNIGDGFDFGRMKARNKAMLALFEMAGKVAAYDTTVLITGESGTGKELIARGIHFNSPRAEGPLIPVNCGGIPESLLESELFGYKKGAFTGANQDRKGLFREADGGTIFLDEIGELPHALQVKLLRVLQESEVRPVGDAKPGKIDVRVIAATSRDLEADVNTRQFREDLFYRINVVALHLPPLRERPEDIPLLCAHFIEKFNQKLGKPIKGIASPAMAQLLAYQWPGNVRELENTIERAVVLADAPLLGIGQFPPAIAKALDAAEDKDMLEEYSLKKAQRRLERRMILKALDTTGGNRTQAARLLEISHPSLLSKMKDYGIK